MVTVIKGYDRLFAVIAVTVKQIIVTVIVTYSIYKGNWGMVHSLYRLLVDIINNYYSIP